MRPSRVSRERGATLLSVLLMIALMSAAALAATDALARSVSVSRTSGYRADGFWAARGALAAGEQVVNEVLAQVQGSLTADSSVLMEPMTFPYERASITISLKDASNCFNLNSIQGDEGEASNANAPLRNLRTLYEEAGFYGNEARQLSESLADWIDADTSTRPSGAEDPIYRSRAIPHRTAGQKLLSVGEVRAVEGYTSEVMARLDGLVCIRRPEDETRLNINTLTLPQAPLLSALFSYELSVTDAERIISSRPEGGWVSVEEFLSLPDILKIAPEMRSDNVLSTTANHIEADILISSAAGSMRMVALYGRVADGSFVLKGSHRRSS
ncbi:MAG: type II secretion system minor pseudopilin GspK [Alphaproteobacteria bacterium]|nr:type II secretion system minor pseudopilin GspK [Alphaproteobacteria bacterium]|tara:strand:+ start:27192 stop:28175 length:984 start_codon:yes stop_codon:yes gene_type:complete